MTEEVIDKRPDPRPRKLSRLWQYYVLHDELIETRKRHNSRISSAEKGKTNCFDIDVERQYMKDINLEENIKNVEKLMIEAGETSGEIWEWLTSIRGLKAGSLPAKLLAMIDYPGPNKDHPNGFAHVSQFWRFCGLAVIDGKAEAGTSHFSRRIKALLLGPTMIVDQFVRHQTPVYRDIYDREKRRQREKHPDPLCNSCHEVAEKKGQSWVCPNGCKVSSGFKVRYTDMHVDRMARRKVAKIFLQHLWVLWREQEGLPITPPWILREGTGHTSYIEPVMLELVEA